MTLHIFLCFTKMINQLEHPRSNITDYKSRCCSKILIIMLELEETLAAIHSNAIIKDMRPKESKKSS